MEDLEPEVQLVLVVLVVDLGKSITAVLLLVKVILMSCIFLVWSKFIKYSKIYNLYRWLNFRRFWRKR